MSSIVAYFSTLEEIFSVFAWPWPGNKLSAICYYLTSAPLLQVEFF